MKRTKGDTRKQDELSERKKEELIVERMMTGKRKLEIGPDSLKLTKLGESEDIEAFLTTFERSLFDNI